MGGAREFKKGEEVGSPRAVRSDLTWSDQKSVFRDVYPLPRRVFSTFR